MRIKKRNEWKTAFRTYYDHFEYQVILFGLTNILATFQGYIYKIPAEKLDVFIIVHLNNIIIYTKSKREENVEAVQWVLDQLQKYLLYINLKKYQFYQDEIRFLGYIISHQGI